MADYIVFSGETSSGIILGNNFMSVFRGGTAGSTTINSGGKMSVDGTAKRTTVNSGGEMDVWPSGTANSTTVNSGGIMCVEGGTANEITIKSGGFLLISRGTATDISASSGACLDFVIGKGTYIAGTLAGSAFEIKDGVVSQYAIPSGVYLLVQSDCLANSITVNSGGSMCVESDGVANGTSIDSDGELSVVRGGVANNTVVNSNGSLVVYNGGTANSNSINSGGTMYVFSSPSDLPSYPPEGTADNTLINFGGTMHVYYSGTANNTTVNSSGTMWVVCAGAINRTTINSGGGVHIGPGDVGPSGISFSGGTANSTTVNVDGQLYVSSGATANNTMVFSGGMMYVDSGGITNNTTAELGGLLCISSGGTATNVAVSSGAICHFVIAQDTYIAGESAGAAFEIKDGIVSQFHVNDGSYLGIVSGCFAYDTFVSDGGVLDVFDGTAYDTTVNAGSLGVFGNGYASNVDLNGKTHLQKAEMHVRDAVVEGVTIEKYGDFFVSAGGMAIDTTVNSMGNMFVEGGQANSTTVNNGGYLHIGQFSTLNDISVNNGGILHIASRGKMTGQMNFMTGADVSVEKQASIYFDITEIAPGADARLNDLSRISDWRDADFTVIVSESQKKGVYKLAENAIGFSEKGLYLTNLVNRSMLYVGDTLEFKGEIYSLTLNLGALSLVVGDYIPVEPEPEPEPETEYSTVGFFAGCFAADVQTLLAREKKEVNGTDRMIEIYKDGSKWGEGLTLEAGWKIAGVGDFSGDGLDDFLRVNEEGYVVGEMSNGNGTFSPQVLNFKGEGWDILGTGDFNGNGTDDVLVANPTGASEVVGLLGYWESGSTWTLINGYSPEWECVSTGDFNGDGKCDMLWRNSFVGAGDLTYNAYCTWIVDDPVDWRMVSVANPREWNFLCSGDFDGNGSHDIAMINGVGVVGIWGVNDGYLNSWSILSAVTSEWQLAGVADFNADGTDDIAWCNTESGQVGYWQINDKQLTTWANLATIG